MKDEVIAPYGIYGEKGPSAYFQGKYQSYGPYQWSIKYYDWDADWEIEEAHHAFFYDDFADLKEYVGRDIEVSIAGRSGGWLVVDEDLTKDEVQKVTEWVVATMKSLPDFLKEVRAERKAEEEAEKEAEEKLRNSKAVKESVKFLEKKFGKDFSLVVKGVRIK